MAKNIVLIVMITMTLILGVFMTKPLILTILSQNLNSYNNTNKDSQNIDNNEHDTKKNIQEAKLEPNPVTTPLVTTPEPQPVIVQQPSNPKPTPQPVLVQQPPNPKPEPKPDQVAPLLEVQEATRELEVLRLVNVERQKAGKKPLKYLSTLEQGANIRALEIIDLWSHTRPDGTRFVTAFDYMQFAKLGENLASGPRTPKDVVALWMNSDSHRQNVLSDNYEHMAIAVSKNADGRLYWIQVLYQGQQ